MEKWRRILSLKQKSKKIESNVMLSRIIMSISLIVMCMMGMGLSAFAYFSCTISSNKNVIKAANYTIEADVLGTLADDCSMTESNGVYTLINNNPIMEKGFTFMLKKMGNGSVGYCRIEVKTNANAPDVEEDVQVFYTEPIGTYTEGIVNERYVHISVPANQHAEVKFVARWGTCADLERIVDEDLEKGVIFIVPTYVPVTVEATPEPTPEPTPSPTVEATPSPTVEATPSPTVEATPSPTVEATPEPTPTVTLEPTATPSPTPTATPEPTATPSPTPTVTAEPTQEPEATSTVEVTQEPEVTPMAEETQEPEVMLTDQVTEDSILAESDIQ